MEGGKSDKPLVFFGPKKEEEMTPNHSELHGADRYAMNTAVKTVGGKPMVVECELPVENMERDDVAEVDERGIENTYQSILNYGVAAHLGKVEPDSIKDTYELSGLAKPPIKNTAFRNTEDYDKWMKAFYENHDVDVLEEIAQKFESQIDPRDYQSDELKISASDLYKEVH